MKESDIENLQNKLQITDAATQLYVEQDGEFTFHDIAAQTDLSVGELFSYFSTKREILLFFYTSLMIRYRMMLDEIEDFDTFTISEKLSNFAYTSFDLMDERAEFVEMTFRPLILHRPGKTEYEEEIEELLQDFIEQDGSRAASSDALLNNCSISFMRKKYLGLVSFWLNDDSDGKELTMELTDKVTGLTQELLYTSVADRTLDLVKFIYSNDILSRQFPLWDRITSTFEIK